MLLQPIHSTSFQGYLAADETRMQHGDNFDFFFLSVFDRCFIPLSCFRRKWPGPVRGAGRRPLGGRASLITFGKARRVRRRTLPSRNTPRRLRTFANLNHEADGNNRAGRHQARSHDRIAKLKMPIIVFGSRFWIDLAFGSIPLFLVPQGLALA